MLDDGAQPLHALRSRGALVAILAEERGDRGHQIERAIDRRVAAARVGADRDEIAGIAPRREVTAQRRRRLRFVTRQEIAREPKTENWSEVWV